MTQPNNRKLRFDRMLRAVGPFVAMAAINGFANASSKGWKAGKFDMNFGPRVQARFHPGPGRNGKFRFNGREGVPLDHLDMDDEAPTEVILASSDHLVIAEGPDFSITLQGSAAAKAQTRFALEDGTLFVMRDCDSDDTVDEEADGGVDASPATITITMPPARRVTLAGSGRLTLQALASKADIVIAGSGKAKAEDIAVEKLSVTIAGSGSFKAGGTAKRLEVSVAGSGKATLGGLKVDEAEIDIAGSGSVTFASDGIVNANIMGSGNVTVRGGARCSVHSMGSGSLICEREAEAAN